MYIFILLLCSLNFFFSYLLDNSIRQSTRETDHFRFSCVRWYGLYLSFFELAKRFPCAGPNVQLEQVLVETAIGMAERSKTAVNVNYKDGNGSFMGQWRHLPCILNSGDQTRLSGMYLRSSPYTATAPDGTGRLFIASKKKGIMATLPAI